MRRFVFVALAVCLFIGITFAQKRNLAVKASSSIYQGDLILNGSNVTEIEGRFDINGSIIVKGNASLVLRNAIVNFTQTDGWQHGMCFEQPANGNPQLECTNSTITSDYWFDVRFTGNTSATIDNSTIKAYIYVYDYSVVSVFNSEIDRCLSCGQGSPTAAVHNSTVKELSVRSHSVNCTINGVAPGFFKFWNYMINCSVELGSGSAWAPNVTITETTVESWSFVFYEKSNVTATNSIIFTFQTCEYSNLSVYDSRISNAFMFSNSVARFVNCTISFSMAYSQAKAYVGWYLDVHVIDSIGQTVPLSNVTAYCQNGAPFDSKLTDSFGLARFVLSEKMQNATGEYSYGNYTVEATYESYSTDTTVNMTENQQITLTLEGAYVRYLTISATAGGTTEPSPETYVHINGTLVFVTAIPNLNYTFEHWILDGVNAGSDNPVEILMDYNHTLLAVFVLRNYTLTVTSTIGGTTDPPSGTYNYTTGSSANVTAMPNEGYSFNYWLLDGDEKTENPITILMSTNHTLEPVFTDDIPPEISVPIQEPSENVPAFQNVTVTVNVTDLGSGVHNVTLWYSLDNGTTWMDIDMTEISIHTYQATIPGYENCTWITYEIIAYDNNGNPATNDNLGYHYVYHVIPEFPSFLILPLFMLATLLAVIVYRRKRT